MTGSEKQVKWAKDIKSNLDFNSIKNQVAGNDAAIKVIEFIENNEYASFWIDYRDHQVTDLLRAISTTGLRIRGFGFDHKAKVDQTGQITITWEEIISDGKGGYKKTFIETV